MSWAAIANRGFGFSEYRLVIEGWPYQFVTSPDMEYTMSDSRRRVACLMREGFEWRELIDPPLAEIDGDAPTFRFFEPGQGYDLATILAKQPTVQLTLEESTFDPNGSFSNVFTIKQAGLAYDPTSDNPYLHIGNECVKGIAVTTTADDTLGSLVVERGVWDTSGAQTHFATTSQAENASAPVLSDVPYTLEGRRCWFYGYCGTGDDPYGDGTLLWEGECQTDALYQGDGMWAVPTQQPHVALEEDILALAGEPISIRGIHSRVSLEMQAISPGLVGSRTDVELAGFWETQSDFLSDLNLLLENARTDSGVPYADDSDDWAGVNVSSSITVDGAYSTLDASGISSLAAYEEDGQTAYVGGALDGQEQALRGRWSLQYTQGATYNFHVLSVASGVEPNFQITNVDGDFAHIYGSGGTFVYPNDLGIVALISFGAGDYRLIADPSMDSTTWTLGTGVSGTLPGAGRVPRHDGSSGNPKTNRERLYVSNVPSIASSTGDAVAARIQNQFIDGDYYDQNVEINPTDGYFESLGGTTVYITPSAYRGQNLLVEPVEYSEFELSLIYGFSTNGSAASPDAIEPDEFFAALREQSKFSDRTVIPPLHNGTIDEWTSGTYTEAWKERRYIYDEPQSFWDIASPILIMHKRVPYYTDNGTLSIRNLPSFGTTTSKVINADDIGEQPEFERSGILGAVSTVKVTQSKEPFSGDFVGPEVFIRSTRVLSTVGQKRAVDVEWAPFAGYKTAIQSQTENAALRIPTAAEMGDHFSDYFEIFSLGQYAIKVKLPLTYFDFVCGDVVSFSSSLVPNPVSGGYGVSGVAAIIVERTVNLDDAYVRLSLITDFSAAVT